MRSLGVSFVEVARDLLPWGLAAGLVALLDRLRAYEPRPRALADNLQWATVAAPGVIENRDGALLRTWSYRGIDTRIAAPEELNALSRAVALTIARLGAGVMLHADAVRRPAQPYQPSEHFPDGISRRFDEERCALYQREPHFETECFLTLTFRPPLKAARTAQRWFLRGISTDANEEDTLHLARFEELSALIENHLGAALHLRRLTTEEQLSYLHLCLTGIDRPVAEPAGVLVAHALSDQDFIGGWKPRIGTKHLAVVRVTDYPSAATTPALLDPLTDLPCAYRWSTRVLTIPPEAADKEVKDRQWMWYARRQDVRARLRRAFSKEQASPDPDEREIFEDRSARAMATDAASLLERLHSKEEVLCAYTTAIVVMDEEATTVETATAECIKALARRGFGAALETANTVDAWMGSIPGHGAPNLRRDAIPSANVADLLPVTGAWAGLATIPSPYFPPNSPPLLWASTDGSTPFRFNLHHQDVFHAVVLGPTGAGKSYLLAHLALQFLRYPGAQVFVFDKGYSNYLPCLAVGGIHYDLASPLSGGLDRPSEGEWLLPSGLPEGSSPSEPRGDDPNRPMAGTRPFQPLAEIDRESERAWAVSWLDTLLRLQGLATTATDRNALARALELLATQEAPFRTLDNLAAQLPEPRIQAALRPYCSGGPLAGLLNGSSDPLASSHYLCFELGHILEADERALVPVQLYLAHALAKRRTTSRPTLLIWDEAWRALADPFCRAWIKNDLATARKQNCGVVLVTQSIAQLAEPELRTLVDEAAQTKVFLPNPSAAKPETRKLYEALGLSERLIDIVATITPKRDYLYLSPYAARVFQLGSTELARALLTPPPHTTEESLVNQIRALRAEHPDDWLSIYLSRRNA